MAYEFVDFIKPQGDSKFYILEDNFVKGGFRVVDTVAEMETLNTTVLKKGMYVSVLAENGKLYRCSELTLGVDEFGDPTSTVVFEPVPSGGIDGGLPGQMPTRSADPLVPFIWNWVEKLPDNAAYTYTNGSVTRITETFGPDNKVTDIFYNANGAVSSMTTTYLGYQRVETYTYSSGYITNITSVTTKLP